MNDDRKLIIETLLSDKKVTVELIRNKRTYVFKQQQLLPRTCRQIIFKDTDILEAELKDYLVTTDKLSSTISSSTKQLSPFEVVQVAMENINYIYDERENKWRDMTNNEVRMDFVAMALWNYIQGNMPLTKLSKSNVIDILLHFGGSIALEAQNLCKKELAYNPSITSDMDKLLTIICGENYDPMYKLVLESKIWSIKRSLFGLRKWNPFLLSFYGKENTGKGVLTKALFANVLPTQLYGEIDRMDDIVSDNRFKRMLSDNVCVSIPEVAGGKETTTEALKAIIDRETVDQRIMSSTGFQKLSIHADIICTSNERLSQVFRADYCVRKWAEIELKDRTHDVLMKEVTIPLLGDETKGTPPTINIKSIWQAINENGDNPMYAKYIEYQSWTTSKCLYWSKANLFIRDDYYRMIEALRNGEQLNYCEDGDETGTWILNGTKYYERYKDECEKDKEIMNRNKFHERMQKLFGYKKLKKTNHSMNIFYSIPSELPSFVMGGNDQ